MIGSFTIIRNEAEWIGGHLEMWLPILSQMVFFDGNSTDGTLEIIKDVKANHPMGDKIKLVEDKDPSDLEADYVRVFNECLNAVDAEHAAFIHPDMIPVTHGYSLYNTPAHFMTVESYAGEPGGELLRIAKGRTDKWKNIYQMKPSLGAHYAGFYGSPEEDVYFSEITGDSHDFKSDIGLYPYKVADSGIKVLHFSDVRTYERRLGRMKSCLKNQGHNPAAVEAIAHAHPRVTLKSGLGVEFSTDIPAESQKAIDRFKSCNSRYEHHRSALA